MATAKKALTPEEFENVVWGTEGWRPQAGDQVTGKVSALSMGEGDFGTYPIVTLDTENGAVALHCFHNVLRRELNRIRPKVGHTLTVKYLGTTAEGTGKFGKGYEAYTVSSPEYVFDWDVFGSKPKPLTADDGEYPEP